MAVDSVQRTTSEPHRMRDEDAATKRKKNKPTTKPNKETRRNQCNTSSQCSNSLMNHWRACTPVLLFSSAFFFACWPLLALSKASALSIPFRVHFQQYSPWMCLQYNNVNAMNGFTQFQNKKTLLSVLFLFCAFSHFYLDFIHFLDTIKSRELCCIDI